MKELAASLISALIISSIMIQGCMGENEDVIRSIRDTYSKLVKAEEKGADVRDAAMKLQKALKLVEEAEDNPENREALLSEARELVPGMIHPELLGESFESEKHKNDSS